MSFKIIFNGTSYASIEEMPPEARRLYEQAMAQMPELADRNGDGVPEIVQRDGLSVRSGTTVRKRFIVNGVTYDDMSKMPTDVRAAYEQAMSAMNSGNANVKKNELKVTFQSAGPHLQLHLGSTPSSMSNSGGGPKPIEPSSIDPSTRAALKVAAWIGVAVLIWLWWSNH